MDILNGRIISIIGFVTSMICSLAIALAQPYISYNIIIILNWINCFAILFATIGFGLKWLKGHENLDLITAIAVGIVALRPIMQLFWYTPFINALLQILSCVHFFVFALRALRFNRGNLNKLVAFICVCAGIYTLVGSALLQLL
ncbi:MAG: hypothetical protein IJQ50_02985, partial [Clostridia bacterium]|nr:hypothetical protein [Clostridia bacterium]